MAKLFNVLLLQKYSVVILVSSIIIIQSDEKIVGGQIAIDHEFPFVVSLQYRQSHFCGGSIIKPQWILTAAHCINKRFIIASYLTVLVGTNYLNSNLGSSYNVSGLYPNDNYNFELHIHDIGLVRLDTSIEYNSCIQPIPLPPHVLTPPTLAYVTGWGHTSYMGAISPSLRQLSVQIVSFQYCAEKQEPFPVYLEHQLCTLAVNTGNSTNWTQGGACHGDSGSGLAGKGIILGVASWVRPCAHEGYPDVFTRVDYYLDWIEMVMESEN